MEPHVFDDEASLIHAAIGHFLAELVEGDAAVFGGPLRGGVAGHGDGGFFDVALVDDDEAIFPVPIEVAPEINAAIALEHEGGAGKSVGDAKQSGEGHAGKKSESFHG